MKKTKKYIKCSVMALRKLIRKIKHLLRDDDMSGTVKFTTGTHQIFIKTGIEPEKVWISIEADSYPTCNNDSTPDFFEVIKYFNGFVIIAKVTSVEKTINWFIE